MPLPPENRTPRIAMLEALVAATPRERLIDFPVLGPADHQLIGAFIQEFNYIDFNLRRAIETFASAKLLSERAARKYPKIHGSEVPGTVQDAVRAMDPTVENIPESIDLLTIIERRREFRNLLGHWAARRIPGEEAIVLVTKNESDALQTAGAYLANGHVKTAVLDIGDLRNLYHGQVTPIGLWLARKVSDWRQRYIGD
jgi:hypothetical protein